MKTQLHSASNHLSLRNLIGLLAISFHLTGCFVSVDDGGYEDDYYYEDSFYEDDFYLPPRCFALRTDEDLVERVSAVFTVEEFTPIVPPERNDDRLHVQFVRARK